MLGAFFILAVLGTAIGWLKTQAEGDIYRIYLWRIHLVQVAIIGFLANLPEFHSWWAFVGAYVFFAAMTGFPLAVTVHDRSRESLLRIGKVVGLTAVGFWVSVEVFVHQPHMWWSLPAYVIVTVGCTYVPALNRRVKGIDTWIRRETQEYVQVSNRRRDRHEWRARR